VSQAEQKASATPTSCDETAARLRALSENPPGGPRWKLEFERLQVSLKPASDASVIAGLLGLAQAQTQRRSEYLALTESCLRNHAYGGPALDAIWRHLQRSYPYLRECLREANAEGRAAAARLLSSFDEETGGGGHDGLPARSAAGSARLGYHFASVPDQRQR
jgi:hypothetical protein